MQAYKGYQLNRTADAVEVFHPRRPAPIYVALDVARAKRWVNAYRGGVAWAALEAR